MSEIIIIKTITKKKEEFYQTDKLQQNAKKNK